MVGTKVPTIISYAGYSAGDGFYRYITNEFHRQSGKTNWTNAVRNLLKDLTFLIDLMGIGHIDLAQLLADGLQQRLGFLVG